MTEKDFQGSPDRFGYEWASYSTILPESKGQLERWLGSTGLASFAGKRVVVTGEQSEKNGMHFVDLNKVEEAATNVKK